MPKRAAASLGFRRKRLLIMGLLLQTANNLVKVVANNLFRYTNAGNFFLAGPAANRFRPDIEKLRQFVFRKKKVAHKFTPKKVLFLLKGKISLRILAHTAHTVIFSEKK